MKDLLKEMTANDPAERPTMAEAFKRYEQLKKGISFLRPSNHEEQNVLEE